MSQIDNPSYDTLNAFADGRMLGVRFRALLAWEPQGERQRSLLTDSHRRYESSNYLWIITHVLPMMLAFEIINHGWSDVRSRIIRSHILLDFGASSSCLVPGGRRVTRLSKTLDDLVKIAVSAGYSSRVAPNASMY